MQPHREADDIVSGEHVETQPEHDWRFERPQTFSAAWTREIAISVGWVIGAIVFFKFAFVIPFLSLPLVIGFAYCMFGLVKGGSARRAWYGSFAIGTALAGIELFFFSRIFGAVASVLWAIIGLWYALFSLSSNAAIRHWPSHAFWMIPAMWVGIEYFRSELYYLRFSWVTPGLALTESPWQVLLNIGQFGAGGLVLLCGALLHEHLRIGLALCCVLLATAVLPSSEESESSGPNPVMIAGVQLEHPQLDTVIAELENLHSSNPNADLLVLSEYTLQGPVPESIKSWCDEKNRYVILGGVDRVNETNYYNTAFVVDPDGAIVHKQAKSVPIQFFRDGDPAPSQEIWQSPFGAIALPTCYDLSYTRVLDRYIDAGAELVINPTMDAVSWGEYEHLLHSRIPICRATEYEIPIFRLASSGISIAADSRGLVQARGGFPGQGQQVSATFTPAKSAGKPIDRYIAPVCLTATVSIMLVVSLIWVRGLRRRIVREGVEEQASQAT